MEHTLTVDKSGIGKIFFKEINSFVQQGGIKLNVTIGDLYFKIRFSFK